MLSRGGCSPRVRCPRLVRSDRAPSVSNRAGVEQKRDLDARILAQNLKRAVELLADVEQADLLALVDDGNDRAHAQADAAHLKSIHRLPRNIGLNDCLAPSACTSDLVVH